MADPLLSRKEVQEPSDVQLSGAGESDDNTTGTPRIIVKSRSLPNMLLPFHHSPCLLHHSRSSEDMNVLDSRQKEMSTYELGKHLIHHRRTDDNLSNNGETHCEIVADDCDEAYNYVASAKDWIMPVGDEVNTNSNNQEKSSLYRPDIVPGKDFKIKRIEEWVMDLHDCSSVEEIAEPSADDPEVSKNDSIFELPSENQDIKVNPSMEAIKKYISSLSATSTAAQLVNHGLAVIPFLSAFTSLRALNLSGNLIVRITAGSLPRGLHVLNLSKNNISTVEGLRGTHTT
ncbi:hypothetical protein Leryth_012028 [Lithospermum erythrorhizon]|nr:hypothetical protein Leryth_012028 [Lithospermum erythrorhizon]